MKKYFITSDIHSFYSIWMDALLKSGFDPQNDDHILLILGDLFDRGEEPREVIDFLLGLREDRLILVRGNHEDLFYEFVEYGYATSRDVHNGTDITSEILFGSKTVAPTIREYNESDMVKLVDRMVDYYETDHYVFTHGFVPINEDGENKSYREDWRNATFKEWKHARWLNGMEMGDRRRLGLWKENKTIVVGHYHSYFGHEVIEKKEMPSPETHDSSIFYGEGVIGIDATTSKTGRVNVLVLNEDEL